MLTQMNAKKIDGDGTILDWIQFNVKTDTAENMMSKAREKLTALDHNPFDFEVFISKDPVIIEYKLIVKEKVVFEGDLKQLYDFIERNNFGLTGVNKSKYTRIELEGQPVIKTFLGPMFDGQIENIVRIRYECSETYLALSK